MVSTQIIHNLSSAYDVIRNQSLDYFVYEKPISSVAFDIITVESCFAGIADRYLDHASPTTDEEIALQKKVLVGSVWKSADGRDYSIAEYPELYQYARNIEKLRHSCLQYIRSKSKSSKG